MRKGLAKLGIDWSNAAVFSMLWLAFLFVIFGIIEPRHGSWKKRVDWSMYTNEPVPDWFPIPLFHADPEKRRTESSPGQPTTHFVFGITTYAEYANGKPTLRARVGSGEVVDLDRGEVVVMPFDLSDLTPIYFDFIGRKGEPAKVEGRFPVRVDGMVEPGASGSTLPYPNVWMQLAVRNNDESWGDAWIVISPDGTPTPGDCTLYPGGISRGLAIAMTAGAAIGAVIAFVLTWLIQIVSRRMGRKNA